MSDDRKRILDMLANGKITDEEAKRMLDSAEGDMQAAQKPAAPNTGTMPTGPFRVPFRKV